MIARVDKWESVGGAIAGGVCVTGASFVEDGGNSREGLVFVGAADVLVGFDFSAERVSLVLGP